MEYVLFGFILKDGKKMLICKGRVILFEEVFEEVIEFVK